jgi:hypothetical protein
MRRSPPRTSTCTTSGTSADRARLARLNDRGTWRARERAWRPNDNGRNPARSSTIVQVRRGPHGVELRGFEPLAFSLRKLPKTNAIEPPCGSRHSPQCVACVVSPFGEHNWGTSPERATAHTPKEEAPGLPTKVE